MSKKSQQELREEARAKLLIDTQNYLEQGGKITVLPFGVKRGEYEIYGDKHLNQEQKRRINKQGEGQW